MALFRKADINLPLTTQVIQVDTNNIEEMMQFCENYINVRSIEIQRQYFNRTPTTGTQAPDEELIDWQNENLKNFQRRAEVAKADIAEVITMCRFVQVITAALVKENRLYEDHYRAFQERNALYHASYAARRVPKNENEKIEFNEEGWLPADKIRFEDKAGYYKFEIEIFAALRKVLLNETTFMEERQVLKVCEQCNNVYQRDEGRTNQIYCSERCNNRAKQRRYSERKSFKQEKF